MFLATLEVGVDPLVQLVRFALQEKSSISPASKTTRRQFQQGSLYGVLSNIFSAFDEPPMCNEDDLSLDIVMLDLSGELLMMHNNVLVTQIMLTVRSICGEALESTADLTWN